MIRKIRPYWKAVAGFIAPGVALFVKDVADGSLPTQHEWLTIGVACVAGAVGVWRAPKNAPHKLAPIHEPDGGK